MSVDENARIIWDYMHMHQPTEKADAIFVLCSLDKRVAGTAAKLFLNGYADWLIFSGGFGVLTEHRFLKSEAESFADVALAAGVPAENIIIENKSSNTGENIRFTYDLLKDQGKNFSSLILVQKPYMERRTFATFVKQWPDASTKFSVTSLDVTFDEYINEEMDKKLVINIMVGDLQRIREYPKLGFQIEQEIPDDVWHAYEELVNAGFTQHLIKEF
jgi:uncharacterized SAM-binding protein YcdF (DUF218 family)